MSIHSYTFCVNSERGPRCDNGRWLVAQVRGVRYSGLFALIGISAEAFQSLVQAVDGLLVVGGLLLRSSGMRGTSRRSVRSTNGGLTVEREEYGCY